MSLNRKVLTSAVLFALLTAVGAVAVSAQVKLGSRETLSGTISIVDSSERQLYVEANNASYSFVVEASTRITFDGRQLAFADLAEHVDKSVTITFVPMRRGNVAQSIEVGQGSSSRLTTESSANTAV